MPRGPRGGFAHVGSRSRNDFFATHSRCILGGLRAGSARSLLQPSIVLFWIHLTSEGSTELPAAPPTIFAVRTYFFASAKLLTVGGVTVLPEFF